MGLHDAVLLLRIGRVLLEAGNCGGYERQKIGQRNHESPSPSCILGIVRIKKVFDCSVRNPHLLWTLNRLLGSRASMVLERICAETTEIRNYQYSLGVLINQDAKEVGGGNNLNSGVSLEKPNGSLVLCCHFSAVCCSCRFCVANNE